MSNTGATGYDNVRIMVLMAPRGNSYTTSDMPASYASPIDTDKFIILYDRYLSVSSSTYVAGSGLFAGTSNPFVLKRRFNLKNRLLEYNDTTSRPERNEVFIYAFCRNNLAQLSGFYQLKYSDA